MFFLPKFIPFCLFFLLTSGCFSLKKEPVINFKKRDSSFYRQEFSILCFGDILMANEIDKFIKKKGKNFCFRKIKEDLYKYDFVFANLETPITARGRAVKNKAYTFRLAPENSEILKDIKLDVVSVANNHLLDFGVKGMNDTLRKLRELRIVYTGAGINKKASRIPARIHFGTTQIYFLAYCERPPLSFYAKKKRPGTARIRLKDIKKDLKLYKKKDNIVLVSLHWGIEKMHYPRRYQKRIARKIIKAGADGIIGHHPHWPQGIEIYKNKPIIYSLGNFINGYYNDIEKDNIAVAFFYKKNHLKRLEILSVAGKNHEIHFQPYIHRGERARKNLELLQKISWPFKTDIKIKGDKGIIYFD